jgi:excisionase family DNA binding protein
MTDAVVDPTQSNRSSLPRMLTVHEVADLLSVSLAHLRREIRLRHLAAHRIGRNVRVSETDLAAYLAKRRRGPR